MSANVPERQMPIGPEDCKYTKEHEWVRDEGDGMVRIGVSDYAVGELGDVVFIALPPVGTKLKQFQKFGEIESVKAVADLFAPISGEVIETNMDLAMNPELVNQMPFGLGWMLKVKLDDPGELDKLMDNQGYDTYLKGLESGHGSGE